MGIFAFARNHAVPGWWGRFPLTFPALPTCRLVLRSCGLSFRSSVGAKEEAAEEEGRFMRSVSEARECRVK